MFGLAPVDQVMTRNRFGNPTESFKALDANRTEVECVRQQHLERLELWDRGHFDLSTGSVFDEDDRRERPTA